MSESSGDGTLGRIALKKVRVPRSEVEKRRRREEGTSDPKTPPPSRVGDNPLNALVPYLDLFGRLADEELARLGEVEPAHVAQMRAQVDEIANALAPYGDLVDRLSEAELVRLSQATPKMVRFWLLCRPRSADVSTTSGTIPTASPPATPQPVASSHSAANSPPAEEPVRTPPGASESVDLSFEDDESDSDFDPMLAFEDDDDDDLF